MSGGEELRDRLSRHWLLRLRHQAERDALEAAVEIGVLERVEASNGAGAYKAGKAVANATPTEIERMLARAFGFAKPGAADDASFEFGFHVGTDDGIPHSVRGGMSVLKPVDDQDLAVCDDVADGLGAMSTPASASPNVGCRPEVERGDLLRLVRDKARTPSAANVATLLMLADAIARSDTGLPEVLRVLRSPKPIVTVTAPTSGFERAFQDLLSAGMVLPGRSALTNGFELRFNRSYRITDGSRRHVIGFAAASDGDDQRSMEHKIEQAVETVYPMLGLAEGDKAVPSLLAEVADLAFVCQPITPGLVLEIMKIVLGASEAVPTSAEAADGLFAGCEVLTLGDLALAIRPGMSPERCVTLVRAAIARRRTGATSARKASPEDDSDKDEIWPKPKSKKNDHARQQRVGSGSTLVKPQMLVNPVEPPLRVETLTGYGDATDWALGLRDDLALWRDMTLPWPAMSTRLLLQGAPGTGKTTFARALCNTLQVPMLSTSVSIWLEPSYLGDVLARMAAAFREAEAKAPCILFIDEIDGIGRRGRDSRSHDDYWNAVVNRALELLDGAVRTEGVIVVGATNHAAAIDPALLRSGRLERRIDIPLPDVDALVGILRHHLGSDVGHVAESAASAVGMHDEATGLPKDNSTGPSSSALSKRGREAWQAGSEGRHRTIKKILRRLFRRPHKEIDRHV